MSRLIRLIMWLGRWTVDTLKLQWGIKTLAVSTDWLTFVYQCAEKTHVVHSILPLNTAGSVAEWLVCWTQAQKGPGSNRSRDAVG